MTTSLQAYLQIISENLNKDEINIAEILHKENGTMMFEPIKEVLDDFPAINVNYTKQNLDAITGSDQLRNVDVILVKKLSKAQNVSKILVTIPSSSVYIVPIATGSPSK